MRRIINSLFLIFICAGAIAQQPLDCDKALTLNAGEARFLRLEGFGVNEISDTSSGAIYWFRTEQHTCWFRLPVNQRGEMTIDIEESDHFGLEPNFILFKYSGESFCNDIKEKKILPVRSNFARGPGGKVEKTGLSPGADDEFVSNKGTSTYSKSIIVKPGDLYYLVVNSNSKDGGNITVKYDVTAKDEFGKSPMNLEKKDFTAPSVPLKIRVVDDEIGEPVVAKISIDDLVPLETVKQEASQFEVELASSQSIRIDANAPGYMFYSQSMMAPAIDRNDPSTFQPVNVEIRLKRLKEGDKVALRNIRFQADKAEFMPGSYPALQSLTNFLQSNPNVHIEISGHINGPDGSSAAGKAMSKKRAKAVYDYLIKRGIDKGRLKYKGYGNSQMIWPDPQNERQAEENRRVEIKIISR